MAKKTEASRTPALEWLAAALGALIVGAFLFIIVRSIGDEHRRKLPELRVEARPGATANTVTITVHNDGDRTAKDVSVEGRLGEESAMVTLDYAPARSSAEGALVFSTPPGSRPTELRITGYQLP